MKILVFAPHAQIWKHAFPEALLTESLQQHGNQIVYITCGGAFRSHCIPMISSHIPQDAPDEVKEKICITCRKNASIIKKSFGFNGYDLDSYLNADDNEQVTKIVENTTQDNFREINIDGIQVGETALFQVLLRYKQSKLNSFSEKAWQEYLKQLDVTLKAYFALKKIIVKERPNRIIQYTGSYSVNSICRKLGEVHNIPTYFLHAGIDQKNRLQHLIVGKNQTLDYIKSLFVSWENKFKHVACSKKNMQLVSDNFIDILKAKSFLSYSQSKSELAFDIRKKFNIPDASKVVVAILSSYDEHLAADAIGAYQNTIKPLFKTQIEWLRELIAFFSNRPDLFLIIRVHPREFPTLREKTSAIKSQHARDIEAEFVNLPGNIVINWPSEMVSFYNLINQTNLFLNAFSTSARELTMLGLPVLTYNNEDVVEPVSIIYKGDSIEEYLQQIDKLLLLRFDPERIKLSYRWRALEQIYSHISIGESYREKDDLLNLNEKIIKKIKQTFNYIYPNWQQKKDCNQRASQLYSSDFIEDLIANNMENAADTLDLSNDSVTEEAEMDNLRIEVARILKHLYPADDNISPDTLNAHLVSFANKSPVEVS